MGPLNRHTCMLKDILCIMKFTITALMHVDQSGSNKTWPRTSRHRFWGFTLHNIININIILLISRYKVICHSFSQVSKGNCFIVGFVSGTGKNVSSISQIWTIYTHFYPFYPLLLFNAFTHVVSVIYLMYFWIMLTQTNVPVKRAHGHKGSSGLTWAHQCVCSESHTGLWFLSLTASLCENMMLCSMF